MVYDLARTLMIQNKVPESFFEDALKLSVLILNECRIPRGHNETPEQMFSGKKPDLRKIKKFFSKGMAHISKEERKGKGKLSSKATRVRYLGPSEYYKDAYVCYDTDNNRIIIRRDVKWFESLPNTIMDSLHEEHVDEEANLVEFDNAPKDMTEALLGPDRIKWIQAIRKEINECIRRGILCIRRRSMCLYVY
jgi:hypothetical protein